MVIIDIFIKPLNSTFEWTIERHIGGVGLPGVWWGFIWGFIWFLFVGLVGFYLGFVWILFGDLFGVLFGIWFKMFEVLEIILSMGFRCLCAWFFICSVLGHQTVIYQWVGQPLKNDSRPLPWVWPNEQQLDPIFVDITRIGTNEEKSSGLGRTKSLNISTISTALPSGDIIRRVLPPLRRYKRR